MAIFTVYWQPGCSSCLRAKEFLTAHGIDFLSVNVREQGAPLDALVRHGIQSVPIVMRGDAFVHAQDIDELARFVGVDPARDKLPPDELVVRLDRILAAAAGFVRQIPDTQLHAPLPGRDRSSLDLAYHVGMIPTAFLEAARGGAITFDHFERRAPLDGTATSVAAFILSVADELKAWWPPPSLPAAVKTYYGTQPFHGVLERTTWHAAQHARQLQALVQRAGIMPEAPLTAADLAGLPLPAEVYDDHVKLAG